MLGFEPQPLAYEARTLPLDHLGKSEVSVYAQSMSNHLQFGSGQWIWKMSIMESDITLFVS